MGTRSWKPWRHAVVRARSRCGSASSLCAIAAALFFSLRWGLLSGTLSGAAPLLAAQVAIAFLVAVACFIYLAATFPPSCRLKVHFPKLPSLRGLGAVSVHQPFTWVLLNRLLTSDRLGSRTRGGVALRMARDTLAAVEYAFEAGFGTVVVTSHLLNGERYRAALIARVAAARPKVRVELSEDPIAPWMRKFLAWASRTEPDDFPGSAVRVTFVR